MKKAISIFLSVLFLLCLCACGGDVSVVNIGTNSSQIYSDEELQDAIDTAIDYFRKEFSGCRLTEIDYAGDEKNRSYMKESNKGMDITDIIVLTSSFDVDASGGDGSLNPNSTYKNWLWIMQRENGGTWQHADHGY